MLLEHLLKQNNSEIISNTQTIGRVLDEASVLITKVVVGTRYYIYEFGCETFLPFDAKASEINKLSDNQRLSLRWIWEFDGVNKKFVPLSKLEQIGEFVYNGKDRRTPLVSRHVGVSLEPMAIPYSDIKSIIDRTMEKKRVLEAKAI